MQVHLDAMKDTHLHLACKGVASLTRNRLRRYLFWKVRKVGTCTELPLYLENIDRNFSSVMATAQRNEQRVIVSEPFYSFRNGYKFELELYPDGYHTNDTLDQEKGNFMSIYLRVLVGEYDGLLLWPFQDSVMFTLLDQYYLVEKRRHLRQELQLDAGGLARPSQSSEPACGVWEFVFHKDLYARSFIKDNTIFIKVTFVENRERKFSRIFHGDYDI